MEALLAHRRRARPAADRGLRARARRDMARRSPSAASARAAFFSTEETKIISTTMGGAGVTSDPQLAEGVRAFQRECPPPGRSLTAKRLAKLAVVLRAHAAARAHGRAPRVRGARRLPAAAGPDVGGGARRRAAEHYEERLGGRARRRSRCASSPGSTRTSRTAAGSRRSTPHGAGADGLRRAGRRRRRRARLGALSRARRGPRGRGRGAAEAHRARHVVHVRTGGGGAADDQRLRSWYLPTGRAARHESS